MTLQKRNAEMVNILSADFVRHRYYENSAMRPVYNVQGPSFGAVADGATNDRQAFADADSVAVAEGGLAYAPPGNYEITSSITLSGNWFTAPGVTFTNVTPTFSARYELGLGSGGAVDHGSLAGLGDDDHTQYFLADGTRDLTGYIDFTEIAKPSTPAANHVRVWAADNQGFGTLHWEENDGVEHEIGRDALLIVRNESGVAINAGDAVYITGSNGNVPTVALARADSASTMPAIGLAATSIPDVSFGKVQTLGDLSGVDTSSFLDGDEIYVSASTAGDFTATKPAATNLIQSLGHVVKANVSGIIHVGIIGSTEDADVDHGSISGLGDDDHPQYTQHATTETITGQWTFGDDPIISKADPTLFLDDTNANEVWSIGSVLGVFSIQDTVQGSTPFEIAANAPDNSIYVASDGDVGIGTGSPLAPLDVFGSGFVSMSIRSSDGDAYLTLYSGAVTAQVTWRLWAESSDGSIYFYDDANEVKPFQILPGSNNLALTIDAAGQVGIGTATPATTLDVLDTTTQLRLSYDGSNYANFTVSSGGNLTVAPTGDFYFDPTGDDILPVTGYDLNIGSLQSKYLTLHAAELWVETLVAQDTIATIGGRVLVGPTTILEQDLGASASNGTDDILNGGFETAGGGGVDVFANWSETYSGLDAIARNQTPHEGTYAAQITNLDDNGRATWVSQDITVIPGTARQLDFYTRGDGSANSDGAYKVYDVTNGADIVALTETGITGTSYTQVTQAYTVPGSCTTVRIYLYVTDTVSTQCYYDAVQDYPTSVDSSFVVKHNEMTSGDVAYLEANGKVEFVIVLSGPTGGGPHTYEVQRNVDGSGLNVWYAGDAVFNTGQDGNGFIDLYSFSGVAAGTTVGPTIVGNVRQSGTYNDWTEHWAIGNLNGLYGYAVDTYGVALGEYGVGNHLTIDSTDGIQFYDDAGTTVIGKFNGSTITLGDVNDTYMSLGAASLQMYDQAGVLRIYMDSSGVQVGRNLDARVVITDTALGLFDASDNQRVNLGAGTLWIGDSSSTERVEYDGSALHLYDGGDNSIVKLDSTGAYITGTLSALSGGLVVDEERISVRRSIGIDFGRDGEAAAHMGLWNRYGFAITSLNNGQAEIVTNSSFETDTTGWNASGSMSPSISASATHATLGSQSLKLDYTETTSLETAYVLTGNLDIPTNYDVFLTMALRGDADQIELVVEFYDSVPSFLGRRTLNVSNDVANTFWTYVSMTAENFSGAEYVRVGFRVTSSTPYTSHTVYMDDVSARPYTNDIRHIYFQQGWGDGIGDYSTLSVIRFDAETIIANGPLALESGLEFIDTGDNKAASIVWDQVNSEIEIDQTINVDGDIKMLEVTSGSVSTPSTGGALFVDSSDGDLKVKFANGTTKTIATN